MMMEKLYRLVILVLAIWAPPRSCRGESSTCLMVYKEGGAPAVFQSPKCPRWKLSNSRATSSVAPACQVAVLQGRRNYQEDRTFCALDVRIPFPGKLGREEMKVGIAAVFDGHNGVEASEMASKLLFEYFVLHIYFLLDSVFSNTLAKSKEMLDNKGEQNVFQVLHWDENFNLHKLDPERFTFFSSSKSDHSFYLEILKEALIRAIQDIDVKFSREASRLHLDSGSTATIVLMADGQILVANIGDSKALLCSERFQSAADARDTLLRIYREKRRNGVTSPLKDSKDLKLAAMNGLTHFSVEELTRDHHPERDDERTRVEMAGGYVLEWGGTHRVNGQLAVSRAIGDVNFKSLGVISTPEIRDWQSLTVNDSYLVVASDGVFEKMTPQDVCDVLWEVRAHGTGSQLSPLCSYSLADCIANAALKTGSMDNIAVIVVPLLSHNLHEEGGIEWQKKGHESWGADRHFLKHSAKGASSGITQLESLHPFMTEFERLMVEVKHGSFCCFYLLEPLNENLEYTLQEAKGMYNLLQALPGGLDQQYGGSLNLYFDQNSCLYCGITMDGLHGQCANPESFMTVLGLLESISLHDSGSNHGTSEHARPDSRYVLKKRFGHGSYGEVWLAHHWNCCKESNFSNASLRVKNTSFNSAHSGSVDKCSVNGLFTANCSVGADSLFILKRIMVERGIAVYLSGLREKYFGEFFFNGSTSPRDPVSHKPRNLGNMFKNSFAWRSAVDEVGLHHIARFVESFESRSNDIWLVFHHEGVSLSKLIYTIEEVDVPEDGSEQGKRAQLLHPSKWWHWLKTTKAGQEEMCNLVWQLLLALKSCHDRNITHRDIKPENMVICFEDPETGMCQRGSTGADKNYTTRMRLIDFGSAVDEFTLKHLYGSSGPSRAEQTLEYTPPEALLNASWYQGPASMNVKYDMWSVGVVMLELILGSPNIFQISAFTRTLLDQHLEGWDESLKELTYRLRSFMEMCILVPGSSWKHRLGSPVYGNGVSPASWKCSEEFFAQQIKSRDPLKLGFPNISALRLVRHLLLWDPEDRLSVDDALHHPYFKSLPRR